MGIIPIVDLEVFALLILRGADADRLAGRSPPDLAFDLAPLALKLPAEPPFLRRAGRL
jgi:hypothetical protein